MCQALHYTQRSLSLGTYEGAVIIPTVDKYLKPLEGEDSVGHDSAGLV